MPFFGECISPAPFALEAVCYNWAMQVRLCSRTKLDYLNAVENLAADDSSAERGMKNKLYSFILKQVDNLI